MDGITLLKQTRAFTLKVVADLDEAALKAIPATAKNNIIWNIGHLVVTQQILCYKLSGLPMLVEDSWVTDLAKGSDPSQCTQPADWQQIKELMRVLPEKLEEDYAAGLFQDYKDYPTSTGIVLTCIDDAINFNNFHEGIHLGSILALKRGVA